MLVDRSTDRKWTLPAKNVDFDTVRLLLIDRQQESMTVYTDGYLFYNPLERYNAFTRKCVVHSDGECADGQNHITTAESHASLARRWLLPHRGISKDRLTQYFRAFELRRQLYDQPAETLSNTLFERCCEINNVLRMIDFDTFVVRILGDV